MGGRFAGPSYSDGTRSLITTGNALRNSDPENDRENRDQRAYNNTGLFDNGNVVWGSFLLKVEPTQDSDLHVFLFSSGSHENGLGLAMFDGYLRIRRLTHSSNRTDSPAVKVDDEQTHLIVARFAFNEGGDAYTFWVDPSLAGEPAVADGKTLVTERSPSSGWNRWYIRSGHGTDQEVWLDEFRLGTSFEDVAPVPEPASLALLALGGVALLGRRVRGGRRGSPTG